MGKAQKNTDQKMNGGLLFGDHDAYFTVEAALVIPIVLGILVMIIYLSFYLFPFLIFAIMTAKSTPPMTAP